MDTIYVASNTTLFFMKHNHNLSIFVSKYYRHDSVISGSVDSFMFLIDSLQLIDIINMIRQSATSLNKFL